MRHSSSKILAELGKYSLCQLYQSRCAKYTSKTTEGEYCSEVIAQKLLDLDIASKNIEVIPRDNYSVQSHLNPSKDNDKSKRVEEKTAKALIKMGKSHDILGEFLDYQVPLKKTGSDQAGKIDLVSHNHNKHTVTLIELKCGKNSESILRAVLEIWTYFNQLNKDAFLKTIKPDGIVGISTKGINKAVLLGKGTKSYAEACDLGSRPKLKELIHCLGIEIFLLEDNDSIRQLPG